jgi:hypothetical protein
LIGTLPLLANLFMIWHEPEVNSARLTLKRSSNFCQKMRPRAAKFLRHMASSFQREELTLAGSLVILFTQIYFLTYLKRFSIEFNGEEMGTPWIGMDQTMMARFLFFITLALLPEMAILVLGKSQIRGLLSPHRAYDHAAEINDHGQIVGGYVDSSNLEHGFLATPGNGIDLSYPAKDVSASSWKELQGAGIKYAVVGAWGGISQNHYAEGQLLGAQKQNLLTGAYAVLNFSPNAKSGKAQIDQAFAAVGKASSGINFMAVDVELSGNENSKNIIPIKKRIALINDAVNEIQNEPYNKKAIIYTDKKDWAAITGNCQSGSNATCENDLITLPLWDEEKGKYVGSDGTSYCGDGIPGLVPFKPYP